MGSFGGCALSSLGPEVGTLQRAVGLGLRAELLEEFAEELWAGERGGWSIVLPSVHHLATFSLLLLIILWHILTLVRTMRHKTSLNSNCDFCVRGNKLVGDAQRLRNHLLGRPGANLRLVCLHLGRCGWQPRAACRTCGRWPGSPEFAVCIWMFTDTHVPVAAVCPRLPGKMGDKPL